LIFLAMGQHHGRMAQIDLGHGKLRLRMRKGAGSF